MPTQGSMNRKEPQSRYIPDGDPPVYIPLVGTIEGDGIEPEIEVMPVADHNQEIEQLQGELERVEGERDIAEKGSEFTKQWYAERIRKITDVAKREGIWEEVACILANGTSSPLEPPTYAQLLNMAKWGERQAETRASALRDQLDEAASQHVRLEDLSSLLERDSTAETTYNVAQDLAEIATTLAALPQRAIDEHDEIEALHDRIIELEAAKLLSAFTQPKDKGPCETCGGSEVTSALTEDERTEYEALLSCHLLDSTFVSPRLDELEEKNVEIPCPDCTTGKQGEAGEELTMIALALKNAGIEGCRPERGVEIVIDRLYSTQHPDIQGLVKDLEDRALEHQDALGELSDNPNAYAAHYHHAAALSQAAQLVREHLSDSGVER